MFGLVDMLRSVFVEYDIHGNITFNSRCQDAISPLPTDSEFTCHSPRLNPTDLQQTEKQHKNIC